MSVKKFKFVSPGVFVNEIDNSQLPATPLATGPVVIGRTRRGPGFIPTVVDSFSDFINVFGKPVAGPDQQDAWRDGTPQAPTYAAYAAQAWLANNSPCTVIRVMGEQSSTATNAGKAGWQCGGQVSAAEETTSAGGAYALLLWNKQDDDNDQAKGTVAAVWYLSEGSMQLRSKYARLDYDLTSTSTAWGNNPTGSGVVVPSLGASKAEFVAEIKDSGGTNVIRTRFNFDPNSKFYIRKVFNTNPTLTNTNAVDTASKETYFLGQTFDRFVNETITGSATNQYGMIVGLGNGSAGGADYMMSAKRARTGWYISQDLRSTPGLKTPAGSNQYEPDHDDGVAENILSPVFDPESSTSVTKLFKFHTLGPGQWEQENFKISIQDIKASTNKENPYGRFTVTLRSIGDNDGSVQAIETFPNCTLNPNSPDYIARKIGDTYTEWDTTRRRLVEYGNWPNNSAYFRVEMNTAVDAGTADPLLLPFGVYGPARPRTFRLYRAANAAAGATASATLQAVSETIAQYDGGTLTLTDAEGTSKTYVFDDDNAGATGTLESSTDNVYIQINGLSSASTIAAQIKAAIEHANGHNGTITIAVSTADLANDTLTLTLTAGTHGNRAITRTMTFGGTADDVYTVSSAFTGGTNVNLEGQIVEPGTTSTDYSAKSFVRVGHDNLPNASPDGFYANDGRFFGGAQAATTGLIDAQIEWPRPTLRVNASDGNLSDKTEAFFGVDTTEQGAKLTFDKSYKDLLYPLPASLDSFDVDQSSTTHTEYGYIFTLDDVSGSHDLSEYTWVSGSRGTGKSVTAKSGSYEKILDAGYDRFTTCFHGGFDGYDIREKEPLINHRGTISATGGGNALTSDATETNSYAFYSLKKAIDMIADPEYVPMNLATVPGVTNNPLTSHLMNVCEDRSDSLAIIDLDGGYTHAWDDNTTEQSRISTSEVNTVVTTLRDRGINTSYGCAYYPWVRISDNINGSSVWVPPSVVALGVMGSSESISAPWFAPAGFNRGGLSEGAAGIPVTAVRTKLTSKDRDTLYEANINPIASFPAEGIVVFGQKTLQITQSALDRINVRRLLIFVKREISFMATRVLFDQNEAVTWSRFINMVTPFLDSVKTKFGIQEYRLILDETTTTPDLIDRNVLYAKIFLKPTRAIEFIALDFSIMSTGAAFED